MVDQTPIEFVNDVRMRAGAEMLDTTSMPVSDIAKKLGFSSSTFFTRTFKQYMHTTPTAYRRNMLKYTVNVVCDRHAAATVLASTTWPTALWRGRPTSGGLAECVPRPSPDR